MFSNWISSESSPNMYTTIKELLDALGCVFDAETVVEHIQNNPNYGNSNITAKQANEYVNKLSTRAVNPKLFLKKYEEMKNRNVTSLNDLIELFYNLYITNETKHGKNLKPKLAPKPVIQINDRSENMHAITKDDVPQIRDKILKAVDEGKRLVMKNYEEKELKLTPSWYNSLNLPTWNRDRPGLSWDFPKDIIPTTKVIGGIPIPSQENILIDDILSLFEGLPGDFITPEAPKSAYGPRTFKIAQDVDATLKRIVEQIVPLASHYSIIRRFIENCNMWSGRILQALVAAIEVLLKDYFLLVAQLETEATANNLTLQKLWYFILPTMHTMEVLVSIVATIGQNEARGGAVLSILHDKTRRLLGDAKAQEMCLHLIQAASVPYFQILDCWLHRGDVNDPFHEFMICDNEIVNMEELPVDYSCDYWEKRYSVQTAKIPNFLSSYADIILRTGKYLNVISQCGKPISKPNREELKYSLRESSYAAAIQKAYTFASKSLLELLLKEYDLMGRLKSVKNYFLMSQGDFIVQFMDATEEELSKDIDDIIPSKLESLLGLCLRMSAASHDPYNEDMRVELLPYNLQLQMFKILSIQTEEEKEYKQTLDRLPLTGMETFSFGMEVKWPVSLVLNHKAIACYQMIFRHLFYCKHVERLLCRVWLYNKVVKRFAEGRLYASAFALRQRMLTCIQHLQYYMCVEVLEPSWNGLINSLHTVSNVDEVLERHSDFLESCLADCMLTSPQLLRVVTSLCSVCVSFCNFIQKMYKYFVDAELNGMIGSSTYDSSDYTEASSCGDNSKSCSSTEVESFERSVARFDLRFTAALLSVLAIIDQMARTNDANKLMNLTSRIKFNSFYDKQLERVCEENKVTDEQSNDTTKTQTNGATNKQTP